MGRRKVKPQRELESQRRELAYRLSNPAYTIYHRAALGGLAATIRAWQEDKSLRPPGVEFELKAASVRLSWVEGLSEQQALQRILEASFRITPDKKDNGGKMIELVGHGIEPGERGLRLAVHTGILNTFVQHNQVRKTDKQIRRIHIKTADQETGEDFTYQGVNSYAHQTAKTTGLLVKNSDGRFPQVAAIPSSIIPGAMKGSMEINATPEEAILMLFLAVGCAIYILRPRTYKERAQFCIVVPDVTDLELFADEIRSLAGASGRVQKERFAHSYLNRVVGGAEEAALSFLIDLKTRSLAGEDVGIAGFLAVAMGKVAWDRQQKNRSQIVKVGVHYDELKVFVAAKQYLGKSIIRRNKKGEGFAVPRSPVPELVAANLAMGRHWCANFFELVKDRKGFGQRGGEWKGLVAMREHIQNIDDQAIIKLFHEAWSKTVRNIYNRDEEREANPQAAIRNRKERIRNQILRTKTADGLAGWFLEFCARSTKGNALEFLKDPERARRVREFIFNQRNFERFQNLCLFALVSYPGKEKTGNSKGEEN
ncbi:MAG: type I-MYXAN CRISPR-associated Cas8a1/Cmx1 [Acidobacteriota bacterium]|nr:type I-MYXAN CRISPR-associated Cas8a1/Cmx1 [Acidobacteriota bacterium]